MKMQGHTNITRVQYVQSDEIFAYTKDVNTQIYMRVDLHGDFYTALKPLLPQEKTLPIAVVAINLNTGRLEIIPDNTMVTTFPTATLYLTEPKKESN